MWIKRAEWVQLLTSSHENKVKAEFLVAQLDSKALALKKYITAHRLEKEKGVLLAKKVAELEDKLLEMNDALNAAKKATLVPAPLDLQAMFDEEDQDEVTKMRARIRSEGADIVLAENMET